MSERLTIKDKSIRNNFNAEYAKLADLEDIEEELGLPLKVWIYLAQKCLNQDKIYIENIYDNEEERKLTKKVNGVAKRYIIEVDFENKFINVQGWENWTDRVSFKDYGKTWALTKEELER